VVFFVVIKVYVIIIIFFMVKRVKYFIIIIQDCYYYRSAFARLLASPKYIVIPHKKPRSRHRPRSKPYRRRPNGKPLAP